MNNSKMTRKALLTSVMALVLCFAMLTGTTFAWFTDQETSGNNKIIAGNLDVDLLMYKVKDGVGGYESIADVSGAIFGKEDSLIAQNDPTNTLWEPGKTQVVFLAVENKGNLALKYNILVNVVDGGLAPALEYAILDGVEYSDTVLDGLDWATIKAKYPLAIGQVEGGVITAAQKGTLDEIADPTNPIKDERDYFALAVHMKEEADNDYMSTEKGKKSITIDVTVTATQVMAEADAFDNTYDENGENALGADSIKAQLAAAQPGDIINVTLTDNVYVDSQILVPKGVTLNLDGNGYTMYMNTSDYALKADKAYLNIKDLTIKGSAKSAILTVGAREIVDGKMVESLAYTTMENVTVELNKSSIAPVYFNGMGEATLTNCIIQGVTGDYNGTHMFVGAEIDIVIDGDNSNIGKIFMNANANSTTSTFASSFTIKAGTVDELTLVSDGLENQANNVEYNYVGGTVNEVIKVVETATELESVLKEGYSAMLRNSITLAAHLNSSSMGDITIYGEGNTLSIRGIYGNNGANVTLSNMTLVDSWLDDYTIYNQGGKIELTNVTYSSNLNKAFQLIGGGEVILNDCNITGDVTGTYSASNIWCGDGRNVTVNGGTYGSIFINASEGANILSAGKITLNNGTIGKLILETEKNIKTGDGMGYKSATLVNNGGTVTELVENPQNYDLTGLTKLN